MCLAFVGDPSRPHVFQMVAGDEGRITAEEVGEIVLNRFNAVDAVRNSYGKIFTGVQSYDPNDTLAPGTIAWDGGSNCISVTQIQTIFPGAVTLMLLSH